MRLNIFSALRPRTHEGAPAVVALTPEQRLRRSLLSCLLWEDEFYEDGLSIAERLVASALEVPAPKLAELALEARTKFNLRHAPLILLSVLARTGRGTSLVADAFADTIQRADELAEFVAVHARVNGVPASQVKPKLSAQAKKGLARAFAKFDAYQLAKYDRPGPVRLRDVLFLCHAKPKDEAQAEVWKKLIEGTLESPDTWEVALSSGADKKETFERLLRERKLGYLALLRNLRNMDEAGVDADLVEAALLERRGADRVLPFRYIAAARAAPRFEPVLDDVLGAAIEGTKPLPGLTVILVDVSGSMNAPLSRRSDLRRMDAAAALAAVLPGRKRVFTFSDEMVEVPARPGMGGVDAILGSQPHNGTWLGKAVGKINRLSHDRLIVVTDEQSHDQVPEPAARWAYMINVASYRHGVGYGRWTHLDGFSEQVLRFIPEHEAAAE